MKNQRKGLREPVINHVKKSNELQQPSSFDETIFNKGLLTSNSENDCGLLRSTNKKSSGTIWDFQGDDSNGA
jgi:hypothetical protein